MPSVDLYRHSNNPTPAQLIQVCDDLLSQLLLKDIKPPIEDFLESTENLSEQIIGHYHSLPAVAQELTGFSKEGMKLPFAVMQVFIYACVREHASLGTLLKEMHALYSDEQDQAALEAMAGVLHHNTLMRVPRPTLWANDGTLKHNPSAFCPIHSQSYIREVSDYFARGEEGVIKILADYPQMDESSRKMLDRDLCKRVYRSLLSDDHPVRGVLDGKLNHVDDGLVRIKKLFEFIERDNEASGFNGVSGFYGISGFDEMDDFDKMDGFDERFEHAFSLIQAMPAAEAEQVIIGIAHMIKDWMMGESGFGFEYIAEPDLAIERLVRVFEQARVLGLDPLCEVGKYTMSDAGKSPKLMVEYILSGGFDTDSDSEFDVQTSSACADAAVISCDEDFLLSLGLSEGHLGILAGLKGTPGLRKALQATDAGRDIVFGQDLGL